MSTGFSHVCEVNVPFTFGRPECEGDLSPFSEPFICHGRRLRNQAARDIKALMLCFVCQAEG